MNDDRMREATGRGEAEWFDTIDADGLREADHSVIAAHLHDRYGLSSWWSQTVTVEYEKAVGRRVLGQTADGRFQVGVNRSLPADPAVLWETLESPEALELILGTVGRTGGFHALRGESGGVDFETTTYRPGSHVRLRFRMPDWSESSILQIRVTAKDTGGSTLSFHHEKLPDAAARADMKDRWIAAADGIGALTAGLGP